MNKNKNCFASELQFFSIKAFAPDIGEQCH